MNQLIKTICLVVITAAIIISAIFYCWSVWERQRYYDRQESGQINWDAIYK